MSSSAPYPLAAPLYSTVTFRCMKVDTAAAIELEDTSIQITYPWSIVLPRKAAPYHPCSTQITKSVGIVPQVGFTQKQVFLLRQCKYILRWKTQREVFNSSL